MLCPENTIAIFKGNFLKDHKAKNVVFALLTAVYRRVAMPGNDQCRIVFMHGISRKRHWADQPACGFADGVRLLAQSF